MSGYSYEEVEEAVSHSEIGGGDGYDVIEDDYDPIKQSDVDVVVATEAGLYREVEKPSQTVYVDDAVTMFLDEPLVLAEGTKLVSGRKDTDSLATLVCAEKGEGSSAENGIIRIKNTNNRISGIELRGPVTMGGFIDSSKISENLSIGIRVYENTRIDNCEIYGFPFAGIRIGSRTKNPSVEVDHCHLHKNLQDGLGFGIDVVNGYAHVHHNWFDKGRHLLNGFGFDTCSFTAEDNLFGPSTPSYAVNMHCLEENLPDDSGDLSDDPDAEGGPWYRWRAGGEAWILRNTFLFGGEEEAINIRGEPAIHVRIGGNRFCHDEDAPVWKQINVDGFTDNFEVAENQFGAPDTPYVEEFGAPLTIREYDEKVEVTVEADVEDDDGDDEGVEGELVGYGDLTRSEAADLADSLRGVRAPLSELHDALTK